MKTVSGLDGTFLHIETPETPQHVGSLSRYVLPAATRATSATTSGASWPNACTWCRCSPASSRRCRCSSPTRSGSTTTRSIWDYHVQRLTLPTPRHPGAARRLRRPAAFGTARPQPSVVARRRDRRARERRVAYYIKVHHATMDGQASVLMAQTLFDLDAETTTHSTRRVAGSRTSRHGRACRDRTEARRRPIPQIDQAAARRREDAGGSVRRRIAARRRARQREAYFAPKTLLNGRSPPNAASRRCRFRSTP